MNIDRLTFRIRRVGQGIAQHKRGALRRVLLQTQNGAILEVRSPILGGRAGGVRLGFTDSEVRRDLASVTQSVIPSAHT